MRSLGNRPRRRSRLSDPGPSERRQFRVSACSGTLRTSGPVTVACSTGSRRRRKAGGGTRRGRPKSKGLKPWQIAGASSKAAYYRGLKKARASETENSHVSFYIEN
jgi:hypothetical protein